MSAITTHILDVSMGKPAAGVPVMLEHETALEGWQIVGRGPTDSDGRLRLIQAEDELFPTGHYRIVFDTAAYFAGQQTEGFYPEVAITFIVRDATQHYHVPLLLSPFGYSTYRGS
jgi:5-hydroxyisourate hydrolase